MEDLQTTVSRGEWSSLSGMYLSDEVDFMSELLGSYFPSNVDSEEMSFTWSNLEPTTFASGDDGRSFYNSNFRFSQPPGHGDYNLSYSCQEVVTSISGSSSANASSDVNYLTEEGAELKGGFDVSEQERDDGGNKDGDESVGKSKMRKRSARNATKTKRNVKSKKKKNGDLPSSRDEDDANASGNDDSATSKDQHTGSTLSSKDATVLNPSSGKARAGRGSATDPPSLYARKRRERINERLRILQNIVPNGTKVDISTMLEEAVQYVKFLQLQIKLLSSDDLWMYAPIAYNGMDIGLDAASLVGVRNNESRLGLSSSEI